jgi:hypothetical protein
MERFYLTQTYSHAFVKGQQATKATLPLWYYFAHRMRFGAREMRYFRRKTVEMSRSPPSRP